MKNGPYSQAELAIIKEHYPASGVRAVRALLPNRSLISIQVRASKLGLTSGVLLEHEWTSDEDAVLLDAYRNGNGRRTAESLLPDRTGSMISSRAKRLGINVIRFGSHWSRQEIEELNALLDSGLSIAEIKVKMPKRTSEAILAQAARIGKKPPLIQPYWSDEELVVLHQFLVGREQGTIGHSEKIPAIPGRHPEAVRAKLKRIRSARREAEKPRAPKRRPR